MNDPRLQHVKPGQPIGTDPTNALVDAVRRPVFGAGIANTQVGQAHIRRSGGSADTYKVSKIFAVHTDHFECKDIDLDTGEMVGDAFDVWPIVYEGGLTSAYDLTIDDGDGMVFPRLRANARLRVDTSTKRISVSDGVEAEWRTYATDQFYVACVPSPAP